MIKIGKEFGKNCSDSEHRVVTGGCTTCDCKISEKNTWGLRV